VIRLALASAALVVSRAVCSLLVLVVLAGCGGSSGPPSSSPPPTGSSPGLRASSDHRYLVDQNSMPVLLAGDSPHAMFVNLSGSDLATYLANRQSHGFNILWVEGLCSDYIPNCRHDLSTYDGIKPFTTGTDQTNFDLSTPNPAYWSRVDQYIDTAASYGMTILFDTWETGALMPMARMNGSAKMQGFGAFLGNRYKNVANIIWITGNDFQSWQDPGDNGLMRDLMAGIASVDSNHLQTTELSFPESGSLDNTLLVPYTTLAGAYSTNCTYAQTLAQYNHSSPVPVFYQEGFYEYRGTLQQLRTQAWWAALAGATAGQMYGSENIYPFDSGWQSFLDTPGVTEFEYLNSLLKSIKWYALAPDQNHTLVTSGYGTQETIPDPNCLDTNYVTTSYLTDGTVSVSYAPVSTSLTFDLSRYSGSVTAQWYDPTSGNFNTVSGSPFANSGTRVFTTPGQNSAGDSDWVLLLTTK